MVSAARSIVQTGVYQYSRPPGFPVYEYLMAFTPAKTSPLISNGLTAISSCVAFLFFMLILRHFNIKQYLLLACAFAFTPVIYVNSVCSMDYILALTFVLGSTWLVLIRRFYLAGIFLGLAIGCRITSGAMLLPLAVWVYIDEENISFQKKTILILILSALLTGCICFLPVIFHYGSGFFTFADYTAYPSLFTLVNTGILNVWGRPAALGLLGLCFLVPFVYPVIKATLLQSTARRGVVLSCVVILIYVVSFLRLPQESAYLIPVVPFFLLLVGLLFPKRHVRWFSVIIILSSFVTIGRVGLPQYGPIITDHFARELQVNETKEIINFVDHLQENAVMVTGWKSSIIYEAIGRNYQFDTAEVSIRSINNLFTHKYIFLIGSVAQFRQYREQGYSIWFIDQMDAYNAKFNHIDIRELGAKSLSDSIRK